MRCGQTAKMPDAVSVVRAATTPSAIAPFETTESGRELGQAEPLMAPWWKLEAGSWRTVLLLCIVQTTTMQRGQCAARGLLCYRATTPAGNTSARRAAGAAVASSMSHASFCNTVQSQTGKAFALDNSAVLVQQRDSPYLCCERPQAYLAAVQLQRLTCSFKYCV
jgi:hypothetical protein